MHSSDSTGQAVAGASFPPVDVATPIRLQAKGIRKRYRGKHVLRGVDLTVRAGEVVAIVGANGCGKSTMLKICAGLISPTSGTVTVSGSLAYCPQQAGLMDFLTANEHFALFGAGKRLSRAEAHASGQSLAAGLAWDGGMTAQARHLSGGTQQKLNLVLSALGNPDILLLDEPYQGFDRGSYIDFWDWVLRRRESGGATVVITHMLNSLDRVDGVLDLTSKAGHEK